MKLEDDLEHDHSETDIDVEVKRAFEQHYIGGLSGHPPFICLQSGDFILLIRLYFADFSPAEMNKNGQQCADLIKLTANSLSSGAVTLMLVAVQKVNLEVSISYALGQ